LPFLLEGVVLNPDLNGQDEVHPKRGRRAPHRRYGVAVIWSRS
jgi:hypothetical protein